MINAPSPVDFNESLVLIADDNPITLKLLTTFLKKEGLGYITCDNGIDALELAKEKLPDLILLDIMMPGTDGYETCKLLKNEVSTLEIPVIFLTAKADSFDKIRGFEAGAVDYITKPFENLEVILRIKTQLKLKKAMDKLSEYTHWLEQVLNEETEKEKNLCPEIV
jgi:DNA-binding response OmpR family regulator